jgi:integrase
MLHGRPVLAPPKGRKTREVPLSEVVSVAVAEHLRLYPYPPLDGLVFTTRERGLTSRSYYNPHIWKPALRTAGVDPTRANGMHALRHFYASVQLEAGTSIRALAEYLGHTDPGFTLRVYTHLMPSSATGPDRRSTMPSPRPLRPPRVSLPCHEAAPRAQSRRSRAYSVRCRSRA